MTISVQIYCCWGDKVTVSFVVKVRDAVHINVYNYVKWKLHTICDEEAASVFCQFTYWLLAVAVMSQEAVTCTILSEWFTVGIVVSVKVLLSPGAVLTIVHWLYFHFGITFIIACLTYSSIPRSPLLSPMCYKCDLFHQVVTHCPDDDVLWGVCVRACV